MGLLELNLAGGYEIRHAGEQISFRTRKALGMLAYLCLEPGMHSREHLAALLWPESDHKSARANLRTTLMYLRKPLRHQDGEDSQEPHLLVERDAIGFNVESDYRLDLEQWQQLESEGNVEEMVQVAQGASGPLLAGFSLSGAEPFEEWLRSEREHWRLEAAGQLERMSRSLSERGRREAALDLARCWRELDPYNEAAYRCLMQMHAAGGERAAALQTYTRLTEVLADGLQLEPSPETQALAERIRRAGGQGKPAQGEVVGRTEPALSRLPFVGRVAAHTQLVTAFHSARQRGARAAFLIGEAGIGKSRLAQEFAAWAGGQGARLLRGRAREAGPNLAYHALLEALRPTLASALAPQAGLDEVWLRELGRVLPEIQELRPELEPPPADPARTVRLYESIHRLTALLVDPERPLLLWIDDLQWADAGTLDVLGYLARRWVEEAHPVLLLGCVRAEALSPIQTNTDSRAVADWLRSLERELPLEQIKLEPLAEAEAKRLVLDLLPTDEEAAPAQEEFAAWVYQESQGHPFYLGEVLKRLADEDLLVEERAPGAGGQLKLAPTLRQSRVAEQLQGRDLLPHGVKQVVRSRLERLTEAAQRMLAAGAVIGRAFGFELVRELSDLGEDEALAALEELRDAGLWSLAGESGSQGPEFDFTHDNIREVIYTDAGPARRRVYHRRALELLEEYGTGEAELARHAYEAGLPQRAFHLAARAARAAMDVSAAGAAIKQFELARRCLGEDPEVAEQVGAEAQINLYRELGRAYELQNEWDRARDVYRELERLSRELGRADLEATSEVRQAGVELLEAVDLERARTHLERAIEVAQDSGVSTIEAEAHANLSHLHFMQFERGLAEEHAQRAVELAEQAGDEALLGRSLNALSYAVDRRWPPQRAEQITIRARDIFARLGDKPMEIDCAVRLGTIRQLAGRSGQAREVLVESAQAAREIENDWGLMNAINHLVAVELDLGHFGRAQQLAEEGVSIARRLPEVPLFVNTVNSLGVVYRSIGLVDEAVALHREAEQATGHIAPAHFAPGIAAQLCVDHIARGDWEGASAAAHRAEGRRDYAWVYTVDVEPWLIETWLREGRSGLARSALVKLEAAAELTPRLRIPLSRGRARVQAANGNPEAALATLQKGVEFAAGAGLVWPEWLLLVDLLHTLHGLERRRDLEPHATRARQLAERLADSLPDEQAKTRFMESWLVARLKRD